MKERSQADLEKKELIRNLQKDEAKERKNREKKLDELMKRGQRIASENKNRRLNSLMERESYWQERRVLIGEQEEKEKSFDIEEKITNYYHKMNRSIDLHYNQLNTKVASIAQHNQDVSFLTYDKHQFELTCWSIGEY